MMVKIENSFANFFLDKIYLQTYPSLMVNICLRISFFKYALIPKLCSIRWRIFTLENLVKWYEFCYYVSLLDSNFRQTASNDWHNKLYHYNGTFSNSSGLLYKMVLLLTKCNTFSHQISFHVKTKLTQWTTLPGSTL